MANIIAIDPGASGGIAYRMGEHVFVMKMPDELSVLSAYLLSLIRTMENEPVPFVVVLENVGFYRPGNSGPSAAKFARHVGQLEGILATRKDLQLVKVTPQRWMRRFSDCSMPQDKTVRKNYIKCYVALKYPEVNVTLAVSDALGILYWAEANL